MSQARVILNQQPMNANFVSAPQFLNTVSGYAIQCEFTGTDCVGTLLLESNNDLAVGGAGVWETIPDSSQSITEAGDVMFNLAAQNYACFRVNWTNSSSSSNAMMTVITNVKV